MRLFIKSVIIFVTIISTSELFAQEGMIAIQSSHSVEETANRLENILEKNGITIFEKIDHQQGASSVDLELLPTTLFIFGNPKLGTPIMQCSQTTAIDLPQKMLIWENSNGVIQIGYNDADFLIKRHSITGCNEVLEKIGDALHNFAVSAANG